MTSPPSDRHDPNAFPCHLCPLARYTSPAVLVCGRTGRTVQTQKRLGVCPLGRFPARPPRPDAKAGPADRGLGDTVARVIQKATFGRVQPCEGCKKRQAALNRLFPYRSGERSEAP